MNLSLLRGRTVVYPFALEALLTLGLVYAVGRLTLAVAPVFPNSFDLLLATTAALPLSASVSLARHTRRRFRGSLAQEVALVSLLTIVLAGLATAIMFMFDDREIGLTAMVMLESAIVVPGAAYAWRWAAAQLRIPGFCSERVVIVGTGDLARQVHQYICDKHQEEFDVVAFVGALGSAGGFGSVAGTPILDPQELARLGPKQADRVIVALAEKRGTLPLRQLIDLRLRGIPVEEATSFVERSSGKIHVQSLLPSWLIFSDGFRVSPVRAAVKRLVDVTLAGVLLVLTFPIMLLTAVAIRLEGRGPVFYLQKRVGRHGKTFSIIKFRSMVPDAETGSGPIWCVENDPRVTKVGMVIRKLRIDELPQIWNVLKGEMSFVGPRPERPHFVASLGNEIPYYGLRNSIRPGVTGWAQVQYRYGATKADALEKLKYDLFYLKNAGLLFDLWIVIKTVRVVLFAHGSR